MNTPYFLISKEEVIAKHDFAKALCDELSYSLKTNPEVGKVLEENTACSFSIHSIEGMDKVKDASRVWMFAQGWSRDDIALYHKRGIRRFVVDNEADLDVLVGCMDMFDDSSVELLLRMRMKENTVNTGKYFVYGMYSSQINRLITILKKNLKLRILGLHFHRKSQNTSEWSLRYELEQSIDQSVLPMVDTINIGGGLPSKYRNSKADVISGIAQKIGEFREWLSSNQIKLIIEPGRFIAAPAVRLVTSIRLIYDGNIIVDSSVYNTFIDTFVANLKLQVEGELSEEDYKSGNAKMYSIKGNTPCSMDLYRYRVFLNQPKVGDEMVFLNAGAYNFSTDFCGMKKLETVIVDRF